MYWLVADETNFDRNNDKFFIYGGLITTGDQLYAAHEAVRKIREKYGYRPTDSFKFSGRPSGMDQTKWTESKREALDEAHKLGLTLVVYVVLHAIAQNKDDSELIGWAINHVARHFDKEFLARQGTVGALCVDRLNSAYGFANLKNIFQNGLTYDGRTVTLDRIVHYGMSCDGASHISSLVDIALGATRYCANAAMGAGTETVAEAMFPLVSRLMWAKVTPKGRHLNGYGFLTSPANPRKPEYKEKYNLLLTKLEGYANPTQT